MNKNNYFGIIFTLIKYKFESRLSSIQYYSKIATIRDKTIEKTIPRYTNYEKSCST
jgi:hypothetical protein